MKKTILLVSLLTLSLCQTRAQSQEIQPLITGGEEINITEAPWQVFLTVNGNFECGGSIIAPNFILTAKHCLVNQTTGVVYSPNSVRVVAGVTCRSEANNSNTFNVSRIILHPNPNIDVALLQLSSNITFSNSRQPINYLRATDNALYNVGNQVHASGWGWVTPDGWYNASGADVLVRANQ
jgi:secreted trypsin-like serine protease